MSKEVAQVESFEKLYELIDRASKLGRIEGTAEYSADEIRNSIENLLKKAERGEEIQETDFATITRQYGIRDAVMRLLNQQALNRAA